MGCNSSKNVQVAPAMKPATWTEEPKTQSRPNSTKSIKVKSTKIEAFEASDDEGIEESVKLDKKKKKRGLNKSLASLGSNGSRGSSDRGYSATSKSSKHSTDSGFDDEAYANVITEDSDPTKVSSIEEDFGDEKELLDFGLVGQKCEQRLSAKDKSRMEEQRIMASLRDEGLIARPKSRAAGGMSFEIISDGPDPNALKRPLRLAKLERRKKKKELTAEEIAAKLEKAEKRRKEKEQEKIETIKAVTNKSDVLTALDSFEKSQKDKEEVIEKKIDSHQDKREKHLKEMRDKLKAKQAHAEKVRQRKKLAVLTPHPDSDLAREGTPIA
ncbi:unnamed protein product [Owenia fusiformis]|uniref:Uncharacterized protein n=1 Tax=Owenia fusiformis TaxID=6347 RepID=A0A8S4N1M4_OWEFU|nr:unnamed protein product [Owenia fusiformis]